jgi:hypothetical protein
MPDGGLGGDAGEDAGSNSPACSDWCKAAAPPGTMQQFGVCDVETIDGGAALLVSCGGCGI